MIALPRDQTPRILSVIKPVRKMVDVKAPRHESPVTHMTCSNSGTVFRDRIQIGRLAAAIALAFGLGAGAGPAMAQPKGAQETAHLPHASEICLLEKS